MFKNKFECFDFTIQTWGNEFTCDPVPTKFEVIQSEYDTFRDDQRLDRQSVENITELEAKIIFDRNYWVPLRCNEIPWPASFVLFEFGLNLTTVAKQALRTIAGGNPKGEVDNQTLGIIQKIDPIVLAQKLLNIQQTHYIARDQGPNLAGLLNRCKLTAEFCGIS